MHFSNNGAHRCLALVLAGLMLSVSPSLAQEKAGQSTVAEQARAATLKEVREELARLFGLRPDDLAPDTDLSKLGIDRAAIYYKLQRLYAKFEVKPPARELTVVRDIADHIDNGEEQLSFAPKTGSRGLAKSAGGDAPFYVKRVYFATNRNKTGQAAPDEYFGAKRVSGKVLHYGSALINIPTSHKKGKLETPLLAIKWFRNPAKHIYISDNLEILDANAFYKSLKAEGGGMAPLLVYIHGFNMHFEEAVLRAAQIAVDLKFPGVPIAFSWPSNGRIYNYTADLADVDFSIPYVESFLAALRDQFPNRPIHVIAHSMGAKTLTFAIRNLARNGQRKRMFGSVILAAPDLDAEIFSSQIAGKVKPLAAHWAIYASNRDWALNISRMINTTPRLGVPLSVVEGMQIIDASQIQVTPWSVPERHSYYATKKEVIDDMIGVLQGLLPGARGLTAKAHAGGTAWALK